MNMRTATGGIPAKKKADFGDFNDFQVSSNNNNNDDFSQGFGNNDFNFNNFDNPSSNSAFGQQQQQSGWGDFSKPVQVTAQNNLPQNKFTDLLSSDSDDDVPAQ